jgi:hypothetical protein
MFFLARATSRRGAAMDMCLPKLTIIESLTNAWFKMGSQVTDAKKHILHP